MQGEKKEIVVSIDAGLKGYQHAISSAFVERDLAAGRFEPTEDQVWVRVNEISESLSLYVSL